MPNSDFVTTRVAAYQLGMAEGTLRRWIKKEDSPFTPGVHYLPKLTPTGKYYWNVHEIRKSFLEAGNKVMQAEFMLRRIREAKKQEDLEAAELAAQFNSQ